MHSSIISDVVLTYIKTFNDLIVYNTVDYSTVLKIPLLYTSQLV